jgi:hypothetical protein
MVVRVGKAVQADDRGFHAKDFAAAV